MSDESTTLVSPCQSDSCHRKMHCERYQARGIPSPQYIGPLKKNNPERCVQFISRNRRKRWAS